MESQPKSVPQLLRDVELRLRSVVAHNTYNFGDTCNDPGFFADMEKKDLGESAAILEKVITINKDVIEVRTVDLGLVVYNLSDVAYVPDEDIADVYGDELAARAAFFAHKHVLNPGDVFVVDALMDITPPGDPTSELYLGSSQTSHYLSLPDLAEVLFIDSKARLALPNQL